MSRDSERERASSREEERGSPLGFKVFLGLAALYLGWRLVQGVMWVIDRLG